jgi:hypothetical protein
LLLEGDDVAGERDVVIGGEERDQANNNGGKNLKNALAIKTLEVAANRLSRREIGGWNGQRLGTPILTRVHSTHVLGRSSAWSMRAGWRCVKHSAAGGQAIEGSRGLAVGKPQRVQ